MPLVQAHLLLLPPVPRDLSKSLGISCSAIVKIVKHCNCCVSDRHKGLRHRGTRIELRRRGGSVNVALNVLVGGSGMEANPKSAAVPSKLCDVPQRRRVVRCKLHAHVPRVSKRRRVRPDNLRAAGPTRVMEQLVNQIAQRQEIRGRNSRGVRALKLVSQLESPGRASSCYHELNERSSLLRVPLPEPVPLVGKRSHRNCETEDGLCP